MLKLQITSIGEYRRWAEAMPAVSKIDTSTNLFDPMKMYHFHIQTAEEVMQELGEAVLGCLKQSAL